MDISVIVPLYNEAESLPELEAWIARVMADHSFSYEILFINDGSTDDSWEVIRRLAEKNPAVKGVSFRRNYGKSPALNTGFVRAQGDVVITMDADLQDSPDEIPALYDMIKREGVRLDALLSRQLLMNIFYPKAPLHDGAVVISKGRIMAAGCILPLAVAKGQNFGTRHRAALGITNESDAVAIAVSEERGEISVAMKGELVRSLDATRLRQVLNEIL